MKIENSAEELIDFQWIRQLKVRKLLQENNIKSLGDLSKLRSLCFNSTDGLHYRKHIKSFLMNADIETVWNAYKTVSPQESRKGSMVSFGLMYSRSRNEITYIDDSYKGLEAGQIIFLNLNLLADLVHIGVGHEITGVDESNKTIKMCYLQNGASTGTQLIQLRKKDDNQTEVIHETWYRSGSFFRDTVLYPGFHAKGLTEFHENIRKRLHR